LTLLQVGLSWKLEEPFDIEPNSARISPGQGASFEVSFLPLEACSYNVKALCQLDTGISTTVKVRALAELKSMRLGELDT